MLLLVVALGIAPACGTDPSDDGLYLRVRGTVRDSAGATAAGLHVSTRLTRYDSLLPTLVLANGTAATAGDGTYDIVLATSQSALGQDSRPLQVRVEVRRDPADPTPIANQVIRPVTPGPGPPPIVIVNLVIPVP